MHRRSWRCSTSRLRWATDRAPAGAQEETVEPVVLLNVLAAAAVGQPIPNRVSKELGD